MAEKKKILVALAHPDDETFGMGGTLAYYAQQGVEVYLVCATRGEVGEVAPEILENYRSVADCREHELRCAAQHLGLKEIYFLGYRDSGMQGSQDNQNPNAFINTPLEKVAEQLVGYMRKIKPQVVLTFDPLGGYHHPDHIHIHNAAVKAFYAAGDPNFSPNGSQPFQPEKLYYNVFPRRFIRVLVKFLKLIGKDTTKFGRNQDINLDVLAGDEDYPRHVIIDYHKVAELKDEATACHASQLDFGSQSPSLLQWLRRIIGSRDGFMRAYPPVEGHYKSRDLFSH